MHTEIIKNTPARIINTFLGSFNIIISKHTQNIINNVSKKSTLDKNIKGIKTIKNSMFLSVIFLIINLNLKNITTKAPPNTASTEVKKLGNCLYKIIEKINASGIPSPKKFTKSSLFL